MIFASKAAVDQARTEGVNPATYRMYIAPLIFCLAPLINTLLSMVWHPDAKTGTWDIFHFEVPGWKLWLGIVLVAAGTYLVLMKWFPGWMSAPHTYVTDRLCVVVSGVWWCNRGPDFDPDNAVPVYPGGFVRGVAGTPHYDGALAGAVEPAVIAVTGAGPVRQAWVDLAQPPLRRI